LEPAISACKSTENKNGRHPSHGEIQRFKDDAINDVSPSLGLLHFRRDVSAPCQHRRRSRVKM